MISAFAMLLGGTFTDLAHSSIRASAWLGAGGGASNEKRCRRSVFSNRYRLVCFSHIGHHLRPLAAARCSRTTPI